MGEQKSERVDEVEGSVVTTSEWFEEDIKEQMHYFFLCDTGIIIRPKHRKVTITRTMITEILRYMDALRENNNEKYSTITIKSE